MWHIFNRHFEIKCSSEKRLFQSRQQLRVFFSSFSRLFTIQRNSLRICFARLPIIRGEKRLTGMRREMNYYIIQMMSTIVQLARKQKCSHDHTIQCETIPKGFRESARPDSVSRASTLRLLMTIKLRLEPVFLSFNLLLWIECEPNEFVRSSNCHAKIKTDHFFRSLFLSLAQLKFAFEMTSKKLIVVDTVIQPFCRTILDISLLLEQTTLQQLQNFHRFSQQKFVRWNFNRHISVSRQLWRALQPDKLTALIAVLRTIFKHENITKPKSHTNTHQLPAQC